MSVKLLRVHFRKNTLHKFSHRRFFSQNAFIIYAHLKNGILYNTSLTTVIHIYRFFVLKTFNTFNNKIYKQSMMKYNVTKMHELEV